MQYTIPSFEFIARSQERPITPAARRGGLNVDSVRILETTLWTRPEDLKILFNITQCFLGTQSRLLALNGVCWESRRLLKESVYIHPYPDILLGILLDNIQYT